MATNENLPPNVIKKLARELIQLKNLDETPPEGIKVVVNDGNLSFIYADIKGPAGTPYENGIFRMKMILSHDFPQSPPKGLYMVAVERQTKNIEKMMAESMTTAGSSADGGE